MELGVLKPCCMLSCVTYSTSVIVVVVLMVVYPSDTHPNTCIWYTPDCCIVTVAYFTKFSIQDPAHILLAHRVYNSRQWLDTAL